jgi:fumarate reductase subunit D
MLEQEPNRKDELVDIDEARIMASLAYLGVLVFVPLIMHKDDPQVNWHVKQGLVILIGLVLALLAVPWNSAVGTLLFLILIIVDVVALVQALLGRRWRIPLIGQLAEKFEI